TATGTPLYTRSLHDALPISSTLRSRTEIRVTMTTNTASEKPRKRLTAATLPRSYGIVHTIPRRRNRNGLPSTGVSAPPRPQGGRGRGSFRRREREGEARGRLAPGTGRTPPPGCGNGARLSGGEPGRRARGRAAGSPRESRRALPGRGRCRRPALPGTDGRGSALLRPGAPPPPPAGGCGL